MLYPDRGLCSSFLTYLQGKTLAAIAFVELPAIQLCYEQRCNRVLSKSPKILMPCSIASGD